MRISATRATSLAVFASLFAVLIFASGCADDPVAPPAKKPPQIPTIGLLAFYPFNTDALDASGNDNHATLLGGVAVVNYLSVGNNAVHRVSLPVSMLQGAGDFTISIWARIVTVHAGGEHTLVSGARSGMDNVFYLIYDVAANQWEFCVNPNVPTFKPSVQLSHYLTWHHFVILRNGSTGRFYLDGQQIGDGQTVSTTAITLGSGGFILGQEQDSVGGGFEAAQSWAGDIDNVRIYNRALNQTEITALASETGWGD